MSSLITIVNVRGALTDFAQVQTLGGGAGNRVYQLKFFITRVAICVGLTEKSKSIATRWTDTFTQFVACTQSKVEYISAVHTDHEYDFVKVCTAYYGNAQALRLTVAWIRQHYSVAADVNWELIFDAVDAMIKELQIYERTVRIAHEIGTLREPLRELLREEVVSDISCSSEECDSPNKKRARVEEEEEKHDDVSAFRKKVDDLNAPLARCVKQLEDIEQLVTHFNNKPESLSKLSFSLKHFIDVIFPPVYDTYCDAYRTLCGNTEKLPHLLVCAAADSELTKSLQRQNWCAEVHKLLKKQQEQVKDILQEIDEEMSTPKFPNVGDVLANFEGPYYAAKMKFWIKKLHD